MDNIKMDLKIGWDVMDWINSAQDRDWRIAFVSTVRRAQLHGDSYLVMVEGEGQVIPELN
jgi:hypothetical protein